jgi:uncharacterized protein YjbI with pentapeptide repeats
MLRRRNPDLLPRKTEPIPFAAKAKDLGALRDAVVDAASVGAGLWISYLFALFYLAIAAGAVTHRDLLLESPVKLPFLNVELPLKAFFILGPLVFLIVHAYVLLHFVLLAGKIGAFHLELQAQIPGDDARARLRRQLPSNIFIQSLAGPREVRTGIIGFLLRRILDISLVVGPIALLVLFQVQFLPYHSEWITSWQRIAVVMDLVLLWILWPWIARGETAWLGWSDFKRVKVLAWLLVSILPVLLVVTIATFPGELLEENLPSVRLIPTTWAALTSPTVRTRDTGWATLHKLLFAGQVNYVTGRPQSLWSNVLVLPNFEVGDRVKFDPAGKIAISSDALSLRGRLLEGAVLVSAHLRKADFTATDLTRAKFAQADLRGAKFECGLIGSLYSYKDSCAQLQGVDLTRAELQGADLSAAQLQGADLNRAQLQGADLSHAQLQGADLSGAQLQGAELSAAQLQAAELSAAQLQGADLSYAQLQGASLYEAQLQGANLSYAQLQGAHLSAAQLQAADLSYVQLQAADLSYVQLQGADLSHAQLQGALLRYSLVWRAESPLSATGAFVKAPEPEPKYCYGYNECNWSEASYAALKSLIEKSVPAGDFRGQALGRIAILEKPPYIAEAGSVKAWADLASASVGSADLYIDNLAKQLEAIGCAANPDVINGLIRRLDNRYDNPLDDPSLEAEVAAAFLDEANCPSARGLSEENKAELRKIRDRALPTPPGPGAAVR